MKTERKYRKGVNLLPFEKPRVSEGFLEKELQLFERAEGT